MGQRTLRLCSAVFLGFIIMTCLSSAVASTPVDVYILNPFSGDLGVKGQTFSGYWVGEIPVKVGAPTSEYPPQPSWGEATKAFCMQYDKTIYVGKKYGAELAPVNDNAEWRAVSYLLTWQYPPLSNPEAARLQTAIWRLLNDTRGYSYVKPSWLPSDVDNAARQLVALAWGKDVVRGSDVFEWVKPVSGNGTSIMAGPGEIVTLTARLTTNGVGRANVKVQFSATINGSPLAVDPAEDHTNSTGHVEVTITVPPNSMGSNIEVKATTKGVWPTLYLDLSDINRQDLIGFDTSFELTLSTNVWIFARIFVVPEAPFGTLLVVVACFSALLVKTKRVRLTSK